MLGAAAPNAVGQHLLTVIAAIILGGTQPLRRSGQRVGHAARGPDPRHAQNGLTLLNVSSFWQDVTRGAVLMLAVSLDQIRTRALGD